MAPEPRRIAIGGVQRQPRNHPPTTSCPVTVRLAHAPSHPDPGGSGLGGLYDGGHGADQLPESLDWPGFAGDVDAGV